MSTSTLPASNTAYGTREYWEERYTTEGPSTTFDWFLKPSYLIPILEPYMPKGKDTRILMLGCGNSTLGEEMYDAGYKEIVNIDYSATLIEQMTQKHGETRPGMRWLEMDIRDLKFGDESFDIVIDKSLPDLGNELDGRQGTMDAMLTSKGDVWNPPEEDVKNCNEEIREACRVLRKREGSMFLYATFGQPHFRKRYMQGHEGFSLTHKDIGPPEGFSYFLYELRWTGSGTS